MPLPAFPRLTAPLPNPAAALAEADSRMDLLMRLAAIGGFVVLLAHWALVVAFILPRMGTVRYLRLHYTASRGVDWIGPWQAIFVFPAIGFVAYFADLFIASRVAKTNRSLARLVLGVALLIQCFLAVGGVLAVLLNG